MKIILLLLSLLPIVISAQKYDKKNWNLISTSKSDMEMPFNAGEQTATLVTDINNDGIPEIFITERTASPSVVMYKFENLKWERYIVEEDALAIEAGSACWDISGNGYMDIVFGGDGGSNEVWWWENPYPQLEKNTPWKRHIIKSDGQKKQHDQMFGDFDGDGKGELVFWNQRANSLMMAEIPENVKEAESWEYKAIFTYSSDSEMEQHGQENYPPWKRINEHEGLCKIDMDADGIEDIVGGGLWLKLSEDGSFIPNVIDAGYTFSRIASGQLVEGGRPEVVLTPGDGRTSMILYEWKPSRKDNEGTWMQTIILKELLNAHSLDIIDINNDGHLDIFVAEMRISNENPKAKMRVLLGDGSGNFKDYVISRGFGNHESKVIDLNQDGFLDIVGKPYNWETPRLDIWMNKGFLK